MIKYLLYFNLINLIIQCICIHVYDEIIKIFYKLLGTGYRGAEKDQGRIYYSIKKNKRVRTWSLPYIKPSWWRKS